MGKINSVSALAFLACVFFARAVPGSGKVSYLDFRKKLSETCAKEPLHGIYKLASPTSKASDVATIDFDCPRNILIDWPSPSFRFVTNSNEAWIIYPSPAENPTATSGEYYATLNRTWIRDLLELYQPFNAKSSELVKLGAALEKETTYSFSSDNGNLEFTVDPVRSPLLRLTLSFDKERAKKSLPSRIEVIGRASKQYLLKLIETKPLENLPARYFNPDTQNIKNLKTFKDDPKSR